MQDMYIDEARYLRVGKYLKLDLTDIMFNFYEIGPEIAWPRFVEHLLEVESQMMVTNNLKERFLTPDDLIKIRTILYRLFEANKESIEKDGYIKTKKDSE
jgi:hypothetical protein